MPWCGFFGLGGDLPCALAWGRCGAAGALPPGVSGSVLSGLPCLLPAGCASACSSWGDEILPGAAPLPVGPLLLR